MNDSEEWSLMIQAMREDEEMRRKPIGPERLREDFDLMPNEDLPFPRKSALQPEKP